jgi:hypothetical protein
VQSKVFYHSALFVGQPPELSFDKGIDFAVHDGLDIAGLNPGSMIFDHLVRLENIGADLVAPSYVALFSVLTIQLGSFSILFDLVDFGFEHVQSHLAISTLTPFGLAGYHDPGG